MTDTCQPTIQPTNQLVTIILTPWYPNTRFSSAPTTLRKGVLVLVSGGRHEGLSGRVVDIDHDRFAVKLTRSEELVKIAGEKLMIVDEPQLNYDRKHGFGIYTWQDGRQYEGYWLNGK